MRDSIEGVIFDNDGLLMDSESIYDQVNAILCGCELPPELRRELLGRGASFACETIVKRMGLTETPDELMVRRNSELAIRWPHARLFDGAVEVVDHFVGAGLPVAVATSAPRVDHDAKVKSHPSFYARFAALICGDDVSSRKPNPEIYLRAMAALGLSNPARVLVFEDAPAGVRAANDAGMPAVMVPDPAVPLAEALAEYGAVPDFVFRSLRDVDLQLFPAAGAKKA